MIEPEQNIPSNECLNCGEIVSGKYCSNCGQKFQPTKLPLRLYIEHTVETLFNIDNRVFKTLKDLFLRPGKITKDYLAGKRATYLPPLRIYLSISLVYFLLVYLTDSREVFFANFGDGELTEGLGKVIQYGLFVLVPLFGGIMKLFHKKRGGYYVEYLITAIHIHSVWFVLYSISAIITKSYKYFEVVEGTAGYFVFLSLDFLIKISVLGYYIVYLKKAFEEKWWKVILKSFGILIVYLFFFAFLIVGYQLITK